MVKKSLWFMGISILVGIISIGSAFTTVIAASSSSNQPSDEIQDYVICQSCSSGCSTDCSESVDFAIDYAWENAAPFPKVKWLHPYPITKFMSDLTLWITIFTVELQNGFRDTCYEPTFTIADVVLAATDYAFNETLKMLHEILFIFYPAVFSIAFIRAVFSYLIQFCDGTNTPQSTSLLSAEASLSSHTHSAFQKISQFLTSSTSLILDKIGVFGK